MLKIVLLAYSRGLVSSRSIERACVQNVLFMAISGDSQPSYTHIAKFVRDLGDQIKPLFAQVLMICDRLGLVGAEMFAIDGVKLPANASKERSGTHAELRQRAGRLDKRRAGSSSCTAAATAARASRIWMPSGHREQGLRHSERTRVQPGQAGAHAATGLMKRAIDSARGRALYGRRIATVEPVFANLRHNKRLNRFTLRGRTKVSTQWHLYCLVHNIEKIAHCRRRS